MATVLIVVHLMIVLAMIALVLLQRSEGGALGIGGGGGGGLMSTRGAGNLLTRSTAFLAVAFFATSIGLTLLARIESRPSDILDQIPSQIEDAADDAMPAPLAPPTDDGSAPSGPGVLEALQPDAGTSGPQAPPSQ